MQARKPIRKRCSPRVSPRLRVSASSSISRTPRDPDPDGTVGGRSGKFAEIFGSMSSLPLPALKCTRPTRWPAVLLRADPDRRTPRGAPPIDRRPVEARVFAGAHFAAAIDCDPVTGGEDHSLAGHAPALCRPETGESLASPPLRWSAFHRSDSLAAKPYDLRCLRARRF